MHRYFFASSFLLLPLFFFYFDFSNVNFIDVDDDDISSFSQQHSQPHFLLLHLMLVLLYFPAFLYCLAELLSERLNFFLIILDYSPYSLLSYQVVFQYN